MGSSGSKFSCNGQPSLDTCLLSSRSSSLNPIIFSSCQLNCAWVFAEDGAEGQCIDVRNNNATCPAGLDPLNELQGGVPPGFAAERPWLLNNLSPCLELGPSRAAVNISQVAVVAVLGIAVSGMFLKACLSAKSMRWFVRCIYAVYLLGVILLVGMAVRMSLIESSNVALLPTFALFALGAEGLHFLPADSSPTPEARTFALVEWYASKASRLKMQPVLQGLFLVLFLLFAFAIYALLSVATVFGVISPFLGLSAQLTSNSEASAVVEIARLDVLATISHAVLLCAGLTGHRHFHAFDSRPWVLGIATLLFVPGLAYLLDRASTACPGLLGSSDLSFEDFEHCQAKAAGPAYALAFISMTRQVFLGVLDAVFEPPVEPMGQDAAAASGEDGALHAAAAAGPGAARAPSSRFLRSPGSTSRSVRDLVPLLAPLVFSTADADADADADAHEVLASHRTADTLSYEESAAKSRVAGARSGVEAAEPPAIRVRAVS